MNGNGSFPDGSLGSLKESIRAFSALVRNANSVSRTDPWPLAFKKDVFSRSLKSILSRPESFREIYGRTVEFVPFIKTNLRSRSPETEGFADAADEAIDNAVPIAAHAAAHLFETALEGGAGARAAKNRSVESVLPVVTLDTIAPPYLKYRYFEGCKERPFRPRATTFDMRNAWWLIEASTLVYAELKFVAQQFRKAGLKEVRFFEGRKTDTQAYAASNDDFAIVAFRGTEIRRRTGKADFRNVLADLATDAKIRLVDSGHGGRVHEGFKKALDEIWEKGGLFQYIKNISSKNGRKLPVWFTGHSLGGALATLAAACYGDVRGLYTFGSPRVGDAEFKTVGFWHFPATRPAPFPGGPATLVASGLDLSRVQAFNGRHGCRYGGRRVWTRRCLRQQH